MKINHIVEDFSVDSGGVRTVVEALDFNLNNTENKSIILTTKANKGDRVHLNTPHGKIAESWRYSKGIKQFLEREVSNNSINHIHGVWMYPQYISLKLGAKNNWKTVFTPHGMLEPWLWKDGYFKKKIYFDNLIKKNIENSSVIHAITSVERDNLYKLLPKSKRIDIIPNLISLKNTPKIEKEEIDKKYILFLGRIHPIKGIDLLIKAFSKLKSNSFTLKITGKKNNYQEELKKLVISLDLQNKVEFCGQVTGNKKYKLYKEAFAFVAPSFSEVVGMVNLEAALMKTPVISTFQTGLLPEWNKNGGILINPKIEELTLALNEVINWSEKERDERGNLLNSFVENNYSWEHKLNTWLDLYSSL